MPAPRIRSLPDRHWKRRLDNSNRQPASPTPPRDTNRAAPNARHQYDRARDLPKLIGLWPSEIEDQTLAGHERLLKLLRRALRLERQRGLAGHWGYDLACHASLLKAYRCELSSFRDKLARAGAVASPITMGALALRRQPGLPSPPASRRGKAPAAVASVIQT